MANLDWTLFRDLNGFSFHHHVVGTVAADYVRVSEVLFLALLAVLFFAVRGRWRTSARRGAIAAGVSAALALGFGQIISHAVDRPRPFVAHPGVHLLLAHSSDPGFPSDHATAAFAIALAIWLRNRTFGSVALVLAVLLAVGRVAVGAHYPGDVIAGALLGMGTALLLWIPPVRRPLHRIADALSDVYERILQRTLGALGLVRRGA